MDHDPILNASLPKRWSTGQKFKNTLIFHTVRSFFKLLRGLNLRLLMSSMPGLSRLTFRLAKRDRDRAIAQLRQGLNISETQARSVTRKMFEHLGRVGMEWIHKDTLLEYHPDLQLSAAHRQLFESALSENKGLIAVTGHIGNWELLAQMVSKAGFPVTSVARPTYDPRLTRWIDGMRTNHGMRVLWRGASGSPKEILRVFRQNQILGLLIDQDTGVQSTFVPFFGKPASTPTAAATLAIRKQTPIIVGWLHRTPNGFKPHFERHRFEPTGNNDADIQKLTADLTKRLEFAIRQYPEQWVWLHKRWKTRPKELNPCADSKLDSLLEPPGELPRA